MSQRVGFLVHLRVTIRWENGHIRGSKVGAKNFSPHRHHRCPPWLRCLHEIYHVLTTPGSSFMYNVNTTPV